MREFVRLPPDLHVNGRQVMGTGTLNRNSNTLILKMFISDGHIDDNFLEKNLCHSREICFLVGKRVTVA